MRSKTLWRVVVISLMTLSVPIIYVRAVLAGPPYSTEALQYSLMLSLFVGMVTIFGILAGLSVVYYQKIKEKKWKSQVSDRTGWKWQEEKK